jgi:hypothetical protein
MGSSNSRPSSNTSPPQSKRDYIEVVRSFNAALAKLQEFVIDDVTLPILAKEVDLSSFWTAFERRDAERIRDLVALATWRTFDNKTQQQSSRHRIMTCEIEEISNRLQAETDVLTLMYGRPQTR